jgi:hypothetical protein
VKSACAAGIVGVHPKILSHPPVSSIVYSRGPVATFVTLYVGEGSVSNALGPEVWISDSELVSTLYLECSFIQASARDHFALQSAPALQVIGFGGSATDACCSAVMQPHRASADAAAIDIRRNMMPSLCYTLRGSDCRRPMARRGHGPDLSVPIPSIGTVLTRQSHRRLCGDVGL